jgi:2-dehydropantoate 2-reductase
VSFAPTWNGPILIWGAGAIGGSLGAAFARAGLDVVFVDRDAAHVAAMTARGLTITGPIHSGTVPARAFTPDAVPGVFELAFLAVKAHHTAEAIRQLAPHVAADGAVVSAQNGLNEIEIAAVVGVPRTVGCFVNFGADWMEPGVVHYGGRAAVVVGELDGADTPRIRAIHALLRTFDADAVPTPNIWGYLWGKLVYGDMLFATALTDAAIWECLAEPRYRPLFVALGREVCDVARARGYRLEGFDGFDPNAFSATAAPGAAEASLDRLVAHNRRSEKTHSGIWRDLAVRRRRTEVDAQLGPIVEAAREYGVQAPITARIVELIHACEDGAPRGWHHLDELASRLPGGKRGFDA